MCIKQSWQSIRCLPPRVNTNCFSPPHQRMHLSGRKTMASSLCWVLFLNVKSPLWLLKCRVQLPNSIAALVTQPPGLKCDFLGDVTESAAPAWPLRVRPADTIMEIHFASAPGTRRALGVWLAQGANWVEGPRRRGATARFHHVASAVYVVTSKNNLESTIS